MCTVCAYSPISLFLVCKRERFVQYTLFLSQFRSKLNIQSFESFPALKNFNNTHSLVCSVPTNIRHSIRVIILVRYSLLLVVQAASTNTYLIFIAHKQQDTSIHIFIHICLSYILSHILHNIIIRNAFFV